MRYRVNEIFNTIQGEGTWVGTPATFIRLQVCTVGCPWCDTKYTWAKGGELMEVFEIVPKVKNDLVVITGGEPTLWNLDELIIGLREENFDTKIHLETSGQNDFKGAVRPDWITWSPKRNLGFRAKESILKDLSEVKFVVDEELTLEAVWDCLEPVFKTNEEYPLWPWIVMMPEGCPPSKESMEKAYNFTLALQSRTSRSVRLIDRLQYRLGVK